MSFIVNQGEAVGYVGPNGSGKSTTIKMLTGVLQPTSGEIRVNGIDPSKNRIENNRNIGVVFGNRSQLWWDVPIIESFGFLQKLYQIPDSIYKNNLEYFVDKLELQNIINRPERQLSFGQRIRCNIVAAFLHNPAVVYLDEPTIGLDLESKERMRNIINKINKERETTIFITSHDLLDIELLCNRLLIIDNGKIITDTDFDNMLKIYNRKQIFKCRVIDKLIDIPMNLKKDIKVRRLEGNHLEVEFDNQKIDIKELLEELSRYVSFSDVSIESMSIEDIVKKILIRKEQ
ncbi:ATP-binding cassette domain-containing protein [Sellimonas intestinalis]|uniref:ABC transporter ATP-binding protein n=1 Tax=Sellimonas intestinalis TaxID=1653434 RepID=UPI0039934F9A